MSVYTQEELQCPSCGHSQRVTVWSSLNTSLDPEAREALLNGDINMLACGKCGDKAFINTDLLYHDMALAFCVHYFPPGETDKDRLYNCFTADGTADVGDTAARATFEINSYLLRPHIVFDMRELLRYVRFRERLAGIKRGDRPTRRKTSRRKPPSS